MFLGFGVGTLPTAIEAAPIFGIDPDQAIRDLFGAGEEGAWYDPSDSTTVFQDAAGTTPATVGDPVGLILDKSKGLTLGAELVTLSLPASYTNYTGYIILGTSKVVGSWYKYQFTLSSVTSGGVSIHPERAGIYDSAGGTYSYIINSTSTALRFYANNFTGTIDSVTVKELPGNHATQTTSAARPVLQQSGATPVLSGTELVTNGTFDTDTDWTKGTGWTIAGGVANHAPGSTANLDQNNVVTGGKWYRFTVDATASGGTWALQLAGGTTTTVGSSLSSGSYSFVAQANATNTILRVFAGALTDLTIDNISVQEVTSWSGGLRYLDFDGVDDYMSTASVDFTATDKMSVFAGVNRKSSTLDMLVELSNDWNANPGSFEVISGTEGSAGAGPGFHTVSRGTAAVNATQFSYTLGDFTPPVDAVLTATHDIAGDESLIRGNGTAYTPGTGDKGLGNFGNYPLYICIRGSGLLYPGHYRIYGLIVRGAASSASEIGDAESYLATKSGVTL